MGDGESDEPESLGALSVASREGLDNLIFVVNCNLQRLDGPVRGNGKIMQELEAISAVPAGTSSRLSGAPHGTTFLLATSMAFCENKLTTTVDGRVPKAVGRNRRLHSRDTSSAPTLACCNWSSTSAMNNCRRCLVVVTTPRRSTPLTKPPVEHQGQPTVILAQTVKGWALGSEVEGRNSTHQIKKMTQQQFKDLRTRLHLEKEIPDRSDRRASTRLITSPKRARPSTST